MSDENTGASATASTPPPPAVPADGAPATIETTATNPLKEEVAPAADSNMTGAAQPPAPDRGNTESESTDKDATKDAPEQPTETADTEMKDISAAAAKPPATTAGDAEEAGAAQPGEAEQSPAAGKTATPSSKANARRKSTGGGDIKGKKLSKKASKAKLTHLDAQPGDHYFVKLKGHPQWPAVICDEDMLPQALIKTRPVTAARADGTYRVDYADGGKRMADRTYPVMYLHTNEFGWIPNTSLIDLDPETVMDVKMDKMRKDLQAAHQLASEGHTLDYYKGVLQQYQEELIEKEKAKEAKAQSTPAKKAKKAKADEDEDVDMADAAGDGTKEKKSAKKRKAEESAETPQRSDSVKKPKIKLTLNSTPKTANGTTTKSKAQGSSSKPVKIKSKKAPSEAEDKPEKEAAMPKEPELTPEEKRQRKEKEVLFLRHKLQKGLLTRDQEPKEEEMVTMSDYIAKLESLPDLEVSIIRATKINKVLKAILKLSSIPKEEEFRFKPRSQALLETWNKFLAVDGPAASTGAAQSAQAVNGSTTEASDEKAESKINGAQEKNEEKSEEKSAADSEPPKPEETRTADESKAPEAAEVSA